MSKHYNVAVLGGGPGGYVAALRAAQLGASVAIIEKEHLGGTCLNYGCIPSKALLASAELAHHIRHAADMGIDVEGQVSINWSKIQARKDKVVQGLRSGVKALLSGRKAKIYQARGAIAAPGRLAVTSNGSTEEITADKTILAVGSVPSKVATWPNDGVVVCTSDEALHWKTLPRRLLIVGGGVIGCEFACMMRALGVEVTLVEMLPQLLPNIDQQIAATLTKIFTQRGIKVFAGTKIDSLALSGTVARARLNSGLEIEADRVLVATGRRPNTADIGLDKVGITPDRGFVRVDDRMQTPVKDYYCIGDANGRCLLAHAASAQGEVAVHNALGREHTLESPVPNCIYTFPEIATVGTTAEEAKGQGLPITVGSYPLTFHGKAMAVNENDGFMKVVRNRETGTILGVHMIGHNVTECIAAAGALLHMKATAVDVAEVIFAHPTISEALKEAAEDAMSAAIHLPARKMMRAVAGVV